MTKKVLLLCIFFSSIFFQTHTFAQDKVLSQKESLIKISNIYRDNIPESYQYITLNFKNIQKDSELEDALQILVYTGIIKNIEANIGSKKPMNAYAFYRLAEKII